MVKLIIDTDPGIDDAMAIFYAAADPEIELLGLTSVFGNVTEPIATRNALRLLEAAGIVAPVAAGAGKPQEMPAFPPTAKVHGAEGFGDIPAEPAKGAAIAESAAAFLVRMARAHRGELVLCPIGPLTNIAAAIRLDPDFAGNLKSMVIMGGSLREGGNITDYAEANTYHDPHAAAEVFASGAHIVMIGLDVTHRILCTSEDFAGLAKAAPKLGGMLNEMSRFYIAFYETVGKFDGCCLHDPAAVIACAHPHLFDTEPHKLSVHTSGERIGETWANPVANHPATNVAFTTSGAAVRTLFLKMIGTLP